MSQAVIILGSGEEIVTQVIAYDGNIQVTNPFSAQTRRIRLTADSACNYTIGGGTLTASATTSFLPANTDRVVTVTPGQSIAAIKAATNGLVTATAGTLWVTELG